MPLPPRPRGAIDLGGVPPIAETGPRVSECAQRGECRCRVGHTPLRAIAIQRRTQRREHRRDKSTHADDPSSHVDELANRRITVPRQEAMVGESV